MKRMMAVLTLAALAATPAAAQLLGMPVWNNPKGGTGIVVSGDLGIPNETYGKGTAFGARGSIGLGTLTLGVGGSSWTPDTAGAEAITSLGATAGFRVIGGSLLPVALNLQLGAARATATGEPNLTNFLVGAGVSVNVPTPGINIEPYLSVSNRWHKAAGADAESNIGWVLGANVGLGMLGLHIAYDSESNGGETGSVIGIGAHFQLKAPIGM